MNTQLGFLNILEKLKIFYEFKIKLMIMNN